jgi:putative transposase
MARQPRLVVADQPHLVWMPALPGIDAFPGPGDRARFVAMLREAAALEEVQVHALALLPSELRMLVTPAREQGLSRFVQALGRRYVGAYNRVRGRHGTIWAGRFRSAAVQRGGWVLDALRFVDGAAAEPGLTSAAQRSGAVREWPLVDPPEYWSLGNTPFERETAYARLVSEPMAAGAEARLRRCLSGGWPCGDETFAREIGRSTRRPTSPRPRGRPPLM